MKTQNVQNNFYTKQGSETHTRILAVRSWPDSSNWATSLFNCFTCASFLFFNSFMREDASFNAVLLHQNQTNQIQIQHNYHIHFYQSNSKSVWFQSQTYKIFYSYTTIYQKPNKD